MKAIVKNYFTRQHLRIISALVLTGTLSLGTGITLLHSAIAAPRNISQEVTDEMLIDYSDRVKQTSWRSFLAEPNDSRINRLPHAVAEATRQDLSRQVGIPVEKLRITESSRKTWPDGCLGLPKPDQLCTQALVEGWHITLSDGSKTWVYRTDGKGRVLRLDGRGK